MLLGFEHVCLACNDIEKSLVFYRDLLKMKVLQYEDAPDGNKVAILDAGGGGLELIGNPNISGQSAPVLPMSSPGMRHFSFAVGDVKKITDFLRDKGVEITVEPRPPKVMKNCNGIAFCKDPDGNLVEFIGRPLNRN
jgi:glyoxylase I family protein